MFERNRIMDPKVSGRSRYARIRIGDDYGYEDENADRCRSISNRELPAPSSVSVSKARESGADDEELAVRRVA